jgi:hypothetical protein
LDELIVRVTTEVYTVLDEFIVDTEYVLNTKKADGNYGEYQKHKESLEKDMDYLLRMKSMDEEIQKRRQSGEVESSGKLEMTDVVPIGGLVMARLHVLECELRTAIEIGNHKKPRLRRKESILLKHSNAFQEFVGDNSSPMIESSEFAEFVLASCPQHTPLCCMSVALKRSSLQEKQKKQNSRIQLGHFRSFQTNKDLVS